MRYNINMGKDGGIDEVVTMGPEGTLITQRWNENEDLREELNL